MTIHMFGVYFGRAVCWFLTPKGSLSRAESLDDLNGSNFISDMFSITGTLFLWVLSPSSQSAVAGRPKPIQSTVQHLSLAVRMYSGLRILQPLDLQTQA